MKSVKFLLVFAILFAACKSKYPALENGLYADIQTNKGDILIKLHHKDVPMTVANFISLAEGTNPKLEHSKQGIPFYDGLKFHRVIPNFMIQSGDPTGTGAGNAGFKFSDEFPLTDEGELIYKHDKAGVLSMANSGPGTNSSQFFITHKDTPWLDGKHSIFGQVHVGQSVVDSIQQNDVINKIDIIRIGSKAEKFNAPKVFTDELKNQVARKMEREKKLEEVRKRFQKKMGIDGATKTDSGLQFLQLQEGNGKKVNPNIPTTVNYTIYMANGTKVQSTLDTNEPFTFTINDKNRPLIPGWKEGALLMSEGEKARLFIPSYLGYGSHGMGPISPNMDLIFDLEIIKVGK